MLRVTARPCAIRTTPRRFARAAMQTQSSLALAVKGDPEQKVLGDCPFCHRVLLTMEQKQLQYERIFVDFAKKPDWLLDVNPDGTVPVLKDDEAYVPDSGAIVEYLEKKFPSLPVAPDPEGWETVSGIFPAFRAYFLNKDAAQEAALEDGLREEIRKLEGRLSGVAGPFLGGPSFNATDARILPFLYHAQTALGHFKGWTVPDDCPSVGKYVAAAAETEAWKRCAYAPELVIRGWGAKL